MGEFELIRRYFVRGTLGAGGEVVLGIGDDCALLRPTGSGQLLAVSSDMLIEGRHFFAGTDPAAIGHKALAVNLSDLAAMGARPVGFTLAIALPAIEEGWLQAFCEGMFALSERFQCPLVGGDTTRGPLAISITVMGEVPATQALRRDRVRAGDQVWVSGPLGGASLAVSVRRERIEAGMLRATGKGAMAEPGVEKNAEDEAAGRRLDWPEPRVELGIGLRGIAHAAIDISDGLAGDLRHLLEASSPTGGLCAELSAADIPLDPCLADLAPARALAHVLSGGDDYELLFTASPEHHAAIEALCPTARMIGHIRAGRGILLVGRDGKTAPVEATGFDHFSG